MKLTNIEIKNFRGIKHASISFPQNSRIICLIGGGDSGKTTLLTAIEWALWPSWNLTATDVDFYNCDTSNPIIIEVSATELPKELLKEDKFGLYLRDASKVGHVGDDEPTDDGINVITVQLFIENTLEPKWSVISNRQEPKTIGQKDRRLFSFGVIGSNYEKDFLWGRGSVLQKYTDSGDVLHCAFTQSMRLAVENTNLEGLDQISYKIKDIGKEYGVGFEGEIHNRLIMQNGSYSTNVGVFDGKVPIVQRGLGSKRLLSIGMNVNACDEGTLVLVDEVETGLEAYRISSLINQFRLQFRDNGQLIMTTHSRSVVCECTVDELCVVNNESGEYEFHPLNEINEIKADVQGVIRGEPDAFLCKRIIVCEGKTEIGLLRAFDQRVYTKNGTRFSHYGVGVALGGGGNKFFSLARLLKACGYDCCILMDSDIASEESEKKEVEKLGIRVFSWEPGNAIEEQIFKDASIKCAEELIGLAVETRGLQSIKDQLDKEFESKEKKYQIEGETIKLGDINDYEKESVLKRIGTVAKGKKESTWFKRIDLGQEVGNIVFSSSDQIEEGSCFKNTIRNLYDWVIRK